MQANIATPLALEQNRLDSLASPLDTATRQLLLPCTYHHHNGDGSALQASALLSLQLQCGAWARAAGAAPPRDLADCLELLSDHQDGRLLYEAMQRRLDPLRTALRPLVRLIGLESVHEFSQP